MSLTLGSGPWVWVSDPEAGSPGKGGAEKEEKGEKEKIPPGGEGMGQRPLRGRCPKSVGWEKKRGKVEEVRMQRFLGVIFCFLD